MAQSGFEVVELAPNNEYIPVTTEEVSIQRYTEDLANALSGRIEDLRKLQLGFVKSNLSNKQKLQALLELKAAMIIPALRQALGEGVDPIGIEGSEQVLDILGSVESSILNLIKLDDSEIVNFANPKIIASYKMLFELIVEIMREELKDTIIINNIINKVAVRCVGIEQEFNRVFKTIATKMLESVENPLTADFTHRDTSPHILAERTLDCLSKLQAQEHLIPHLEEVAQYLRTLTSTGDSNDKE